MTILSFLLLLLFFQKPMPSQTVTVTVPAQTLTVPMGVLSQPAATQANATVVATYTCTGTVILSIYSDGTFKTTGPTTCMKR